MLIDNEQSKVMFVSHSKQKTLVSLRTAAAAHVTDDGDDDDYDLPGWLGIFPALRIGNCELVYCHLIADPDSATQHNFSQWEETALHWAARDWAARDWAAKDQLEVCRWLMQCKANPHASDYK
jgi:hypothetical protein